MRDYFLSPITRFSDAEGFLFCLDQDGLLFHPEDDPSTVINSKTGNPIFTDEEVLLIRQRIDEVYEFMDDPCQWILESLDPFKDQR